MKDFSFNGKIYIGDRLSTGKPGTLRWVGDASQMQVKLSVDTEERQESYTGNRLTSVRLAKAKKAEFSLTVNDFSSANLALGLFGTAASITASPVTGEPLPTGVVAGDIIRLTYGNVSSLVITGADGTTPLVAGTDYSEESLPAGLVKVIDPTHFNDGTGSPPAAATAAYSYAAVDNIPMFGVVSQERYVLLDGINTVDGSRVRVELPRCYFDPIGTLDMITDSLSNLQMQGSVLYDDTNALDANMGGFGRIQKPADA